MTEDEKFYLAVMRQALSQASDSHLPVLMSVVEPQTAFLYLFDTAYAMGFGAARMMIRDGIDIEALEVQHLSLVPKE